MKPLLPPANKNNLCGQQIRKARLSCRPPLTQGDLINRLAECGLALDQAKISRVESGERMVSDFELVAFSRCLKASMAWLCGVKGAKR